MDSQPRLLGDDNEYDFADVVFVPTSIDSTSQVPAASSSNDVSVPASSNLVANTPQASTVSSKDDDVDVSTFEWVEAEVIADSVPIASTPSNTALNTPQVSSAASKNVSVDAFVLGSNKIPAVSAPKASTPNNTAANTPQVSSATTGNDPAAFDLNDRFYKKYPSHSVSASEVSTPNNTVINAPLVAPSVSAPIVSTPSNTALNTLQVSSAASAPLVSPDASANPEAVDLSAPSSAKTPHDERMSLNAIRDIRDHAKYLRRHAEKNDATASAYLTAAQGFFSTALKSKQDGRVNAALREAKSYVATVQRNISRG